MSVPEQVRSTSGGATGIYPLPALRGQAGVQAGGNNHDRPRTRSAMIGIPPLFGKFLTTCPHRPRRVLRPVASPQPAHRANHHPWPPRGRSLQCRRAAPPIQASTVSRSSRSPCCVSGLLSWAPDEMHHCQQDERHGVPYDSTLERPERRPASPTTPHPCCSLVGDPTFPLTFPTDPCNSTSRASYANHSTSRAITSTIRATPSR